MILLFGFECIDSFAPFLSENGLGKKTAHGSEGFFEKTRIPAVGGFSVRICRRSGTLKNESVAVRCAVMFIFEIIHLKIPFAYFPIQIIPQCAPLGKPNIKYLQFCRKYPQLIRVCSRTAGNTRAVCG